MTDCCCTEVEQYTCIPCKWKEKKMNDKEVFEEWFKDAWYIDFDIYDLRHKIQLQAWQAACEYKGKEYSNIMNAMTLTSQNNFKLQAENKKLQAENAKLKEAIEVIKIVSQFTDHDAELLGYPDGEASTESSKLIKRARQVLKELDDNESLEIKN